ncbi:MAG: hypothetical protein EPO12_00695 [Aquabacterium sp.]|nr:MAG: hypothetical protein EPO12_00695 [Aquabacterium sp.]
MTRPTHPPFLRLAFACCVLAAVAASARAAPTTEQRRSAAERTARSDGNDCVAARPFYWEIGDAKQALAQGGVGERAPAADQVMAIASASKWLYASWVLEKRGGKLGDEDIELLTFRSGRTHFLTCGRRQNVQDCEGNLLNGRNRVDRKTAGLFDYNSGHMQHHAMLMGLGPLRGPALAAAIREPLGTSIPADYTQPLLAGGATGSAAGYADFLRRVLSGKLRMREALGTHAVCTNPKTCPQAAGTPIPDSESWHYSIGHWVEDDPKTGDGAYSSAGLFGFYPWIDAGKSFYGVLARESRDGSLSRDPARQPYVQSVECGRLIRKAWLSGQPQ